MSSIKIPAFFVLHMFLFVVLMHDVATGCFFLRAVSVHSSIDIIGECSKFDCILCVDVVISLDMLMDIL